MGELFKGSKALLLAVELLGEPALGLAGLAPAHHACVSIHVENYCRARCRLGADGLPATSKDDRANHGFGVRSMRGIAEKYSGTFSLSAGEDTFAVDVMIPLAALG